MAEQRDGLSIPGPPPGSSIPLHQPLPHPPSHGFSHRPTGLDPKTGRNLQVPVPFSPSNPNRARAREQWVSFCPAPVSRYWVPCRRHNISGVSIPGLVVYNVPSFARITHGCRWGFNKTATTMGPWGVCLRRHGTSMTGSRVDVVGGSPFGSSLWTAESPLWTPPEAAGMRPARCFAMLRSRVRDSPLKKAGRAPYSHFHPPTRRE